jgi:hypothetical protein
VVFGAERPGQPKPNPDAPSTPRGPSVPSHVVDQWCAHMRSKGMKRVLCLLSDSELGFYSDPLLPQLAAHFETTTPPPAVGTAAVASETAEASGTAGLGAPAGAAAGTRVARVEPHADDALAATVACLRAAVAAQEPVVVFCSTGQARTGTVLSFWLHHAYALSVAAAVSQERAHNTPMDACRRTTLGHRMYHVLAVAVYLTKPETGPLFSR